ncbi:hypothetical protein [Pseudidiomarina sp.]|uniref:hypothetical protein n=1 Tax=Pseudidiomarina sp. TaxID=2081707 RepID=UPI003A9796A2
MLVIDLPAEWGAVEWSVQETMTHWQLAVQHPPQLELLGCQVSRWMSHFAWCETGESLWMLQKLNDVYWLSELRSSPATKRPATSNWRGVKLQHFKTQGQIIEVYRSPHHPKQLESFIKLRHQVRKPKLMELSHGRFYLSLQNPTEDVFIYQRASGTILVSVEQK